MRTPNSAAIIQRYQTSTACSDEAYRNAKEEDVADVFLQSVKCLKLILSSIESTVLHCSSCFTFQPSHYTQVGIHVCTKIRCAVLLRRIRTGYNYQGRPIRLDQAGYRFNPLKLHILFAITNVPRCLLKYARITDFKIRNHYDLVDH